MKSFTTKTKNSLAREYELAPPSPCCRRAELMGLLIPRFSPSEDAGGSPYVSIRTRHAGVARWAMKHLRAECVRSPILHIIRNEPGQSAMYTIRADRMEALSLFSGSSGPGSCLPLESFRRQCCQHAFLRGVFLACGIVSDPLQGARLELVFAKASSAQIVLDFLRTTFQLTLLSLRRNESTVLYLKNYEEIIDLLSQIGAHSAILEIENARILRVARNRANRAANCDAGNIAKMVGALDRQMQAIDLIEQTIGLESLPEALYTIAVERKNHPDATLTELGALLEPSMGKSGVYHRLQRIEAIARSIENKERRNPDDSERIDAR